MLFFAVILFGWLLVFLLDNAYWLAWWTGERYGLVDEEVLAKKPASSHQYSLVDTHEAAGLVFVISVIVNLFTSKMYFAKKVATWVGDLSEVLLQEAIEGTRQVEITMNNGKSYVGHPIKSGVTTFQESDISILVTISGHRQPDTKELWFDSFYRKIEQGDINEKDFVLVLPKQQVESVRLFDPEIYIRFLAQRKDIAKLLVEDS